MCMVGRPDLRRRVHFFTIPCSVSHLPSLVSLLPHWSRRSLKDSGLAFAAPSSRHGKAPVPAQPRNYTCLCLSLIPGFIQSLQLKLQSSPPQSTPNGPFLSLRYKRKIIAAGDPAVTSLFFVCSLRSFRELYSKGFECLYVDEHYTIFSNWSSVICFMHVRRPTLSGAFLTAFSEYPPTCLSSIPPRLCAFSLLRLHVTTSLFPCVSAPSKIVARSLFFPPERFLSSFRLPLLAFVPRLPSLPVFV